MSPIVIFCDCIALVNRVGSIPELAVMFENCSSSSRPSVLKLSHYSSSYLKKLKEEKEKEVDGKLKKIHLVLPALLCKKQPKNLLVKAIFLL